MTGASGVAWDAMAETGTALARSLSLSGLSIYLNSVFARLKTASCLVASCRWVGFGLEPLVLHLSVSPGRHRSGNRFRVFSDAAEVERNLLAG